MNMLMISYFIQVQCIKRGPFTKDDYFSNQEEFNMIYLLQSNY
jgi:hypothetical protein